MINTLILLCLCMGDPGEFERITMDLELPALDVRPYHKPYVAVWLETPDRLGIRTVSVWHEKDEWLKDMRQWWRKLGRTSEPPFDGASGATRKPGRHKIQWTVRDSAGKPLPPGTYFLHIEAAREAGGREFLRQKIELGGSEPQTYTLTGETELGAVTITVDKE